MRLPPFGPLEGLSALAVMSGGQPGMKRRSRDKTWGGQGSPASFSKTTQPVARCSKSPWDSPALCSTPLQNLCPLTVSTALARTIARGSATFQSRHRLFTTRPPLLHICSTYGIAWHLGAWFFTFYHYAWRHFVSFSYSHIISYCTTLVVRSAFWYNWRPIQIKERGCIV